MRRTTMREEISLWVDQKKVTVNENFGLWLRGYVAGRNGIIRSLTSLLERYPDLSKEEITELFLALEGIVDDTVC